MQKYYILCYISAEITVGKYKMIVSKLEKNSAHHLFIK